MNIRILFFLLAAIVTTASHAQCMAPHAATGQIVQVIETGGLNSWFRAWATYRPDGYPIIYYGQGFASLSPLMQRFVRLHECAHLIEAPGNEILANCRALQVIREQGLSREDEGYIAQHHISDGPLPPQYGGSGKAFWAATLQCAGKRVL
jgi:hypothetical protein